jgi:phosphoglycolate phosphatase
VLDNVREILEHLRAERPEVRSYLLTGNTRAGARAKLTYYNLVQFFSDGAFAEDPGARSGIASRALELARNAGPVGEETIFVIGDTPHDIECAKAIGAKTIAVATGGYSVEELQPYKPWRLFETLPAPQEFVRLIEEPVRA